MSLTKQIQKLIDVHTQDVVQQLAEKYGFDADEAKSSLEDPAARRKAAAPKRPPNAFMIFSKEKRPEVKAQGLAPKEVLRELGRMWKALDEESKAPYQEQYEEAKASLARGLE